MTDLIEPRVWPRLPLGEMVEIVSGQIDPRQEPFCHMLHVGSDNIESQTGRLFGIRPAGELGLISGKFPFDPSTVLYSKIRPYLNKVALPDFIGVCSADIYPLRPKPNLLNRRFLAHLLRQRDFLEYAESFSARTSIPKINREALVAYEAPVPPLAEQHRLTEILDKADTIRRKRREAIALTEQLLRSTFLEMFGDPVTNPKGWPSVDLGQLLVNGPTNGLYRPSSDYGSGTPIVRIDSFQDGEIKDLESLKRVRIPDDVIEKFSLKSGQILVNRVNSPEHLGKSALVPSLAEPTVFESNMMRLTLEQDAICPEFLIGQMLTAHIKQQIAACRKDASNQSSINQDDVRSFQIRLPPIELQRRYQTAIAAIHMHRARLRDAREQAEALFHSLVQRAFSGQL